MASGKQPACLLVMSAFVKSALKKPRCIGTLESHGTRLAATQFKGVLLSSSSALRAATPASWDCHFLKQRSYWESSTLPTSVTGRAGVHLRSPYTALLCTCAVSIKYRFADAISLITGRDTAGLEL